jgi:hypothetical protein
MIRRHLDGIWPAQNKEHFTWQLGPIGQVLPDFTVCRIEPLRPENAWIYVTDGACEVETGKGYGLEFVLVAPDDDARHIETLAVVAYYHVTTDEKLDVGRIMYSGRPWLDQSRCDHFLLSLPYLFGPKVEWCGNATEKQIRFLWLLPITKSEAHFAAHYGVEALEERFEKHEINTVDPGRQSVA